MTIISNNYEKILKEMIFNKISENLKKETDKNLTRNNVFNYIDLLDSLDHSICTIAKESIVSIFEAIDKGYCNSIERKAKHYIKAHLPRTILTVFGEITFTRTFYSDKNNIGSFCYLDRYLGLKKHDYFDPYLKSLILEYSANNSMPTVCSMINKLIGNRIKLTKEIEYFNRQTVRNIILAATYSKEEYEEIELPENESICIMADEKWVATQNNDNKDIMVKSIVVFDGITGTKRKKLKNKMIFSDFKKGFIDDVLDYLDKSYDLDRIKNIFVMGDGAKWIRNLTGHFKTSPETEVTYALDHFHYKQALHHIGLNKEIEQILNEYIMEYNKEEFIKCCDELIVSDPHRKTVIEKKKEYILNNFKNIHNLFKHNLSCPMESQISHNLAYLFTSRPKGYSVDMLEKMLKLRMLFKNSKNIKLLFLNNFNSDETLVINADETNYTSKRSNGYINFDKLLPNYTYPIPYDNSYHRH